VKERLKKYLRPEAFPTTFCNGCGHLVLMEVVLEAIDEMGLDIDSCLFASGIGCASWIPSPHFLADTLHVTHGRAIAFATGAKVYNPELNVFVVSGDGDLASIGGNHLIHAARRDLDMAVICANNMVYGMTGGQVASTTPLGRRTATTPGGNPERPFDLCKLVEGAGATYVARWYIGHRNQLRESIKRAHRHRGFAFVEAVSPCPTHYVKMNRPRSKQDLPLFGKGVILTQEEAASLGPKELEGRIVCGEFVTPHDLERDQSRGEKP